MQPPTNINIPDGGSGRTNVCACVAAGVVPAVSLAAELAVELAATLAAKPIATLAATLAATQPDRLHPPGCPQDGGSRLGALQKEVETAKGSGDAWVYADMYYAHMIICLVLSPAARASSVGRRT